MEATAKGLELECANLFWALPYTLACTANSVTWLIGRDSTDLVVPAHLRVRPSLHNLSYLTSSHRPFRKDDKRLILYHMIDRNAPFTSIETVRGIESSSLCNGNKLPQERTRLAFEVHHFPVTNWKWFRTSTPRTTRNRLPIKQG